jgi:hypothetical protein
MAIQTSRRLAGITSLSIDGVAYDVVSDVTWNPSYIKRESLIGLDGIHGYSELPVAGFITATLRDNGGITVKDFNEMTSSTIQIIQANGKAIIGVGMWNTETAEVKSAEATFSVRFEGDDCYEAIA